MKRTWEKYIHRNKREGDCQLISIVNAYYYLTSNIITNDVYQELADECGCVAGSCIDIKKAFKKLGLRVEEEWKFLPNTKSVLPLEINVWHKHFGFHSILAVEYNKQVDTYRITNFRHVASNNGWIFHEDLMHYVVENPNKEGWKCRKIINEPNLLTK